MRDLAHLDIEVPSIILPIAISFFTFQQIAYLVDSYREQRCENNFWSYSLFVSFFSQLIAGPIVHHKQVMPQFKDPRNLRFTLELRDLDEDLATIHDLGLGNTGRRSTPGTVRLLPKEAV